MSNHAKRAIETGRGRWGWLAILCASGAACSQVGLPAVNLDGGAGTSGQSEWQTFAGTGSQKIDLLFAIDDSQDMSSLQTKMLAQLPALLDTLQASPNGPPDLHVALVSSDTGVGKYDLPQFACPYGGDYGQFQFQPRGTCAVAPLMNGQTYFQSSNGVSNFSGNLADQLACVGALVQHGCRFSGPLKSIREALTADASKPAASVNAGFLRPEAFLSVVLLSNKDDCSVGDGANLGDPTQTLMSDPLGPFNRFRCNELGHLCQINGGLTHPPRGAATDLPGCVSNESSASVTSVASEVAFLQSLKTNPTRIFAAAIAGPTSPYSIDMVQEAGAPEAHPQMHPSCLSSTGDYGEPSVRIQQWASALGGSTFPVCADSLAPALQTIGQAIVDRAATMCFVRPFPARTDSDQPNCRVADLFPGAATGDAGEIIPNCVDSGGAASCWTAVDDSVHCGGGTKSLVITRTMPAPASSYVGITCAPCTHVELGCGAV